MREETIQSIQSRDKKESTSEFFNPALFFKNFFRKIFLHSTVNKKEKKKHGNDQWKKKNGASRKLIKKVYEDFKTSANLSSYSANGVKNPSPNLTSFSPTVSACVFSFPEMVSMRFLSYGRCLLRSIFIKNIFRF